MRTYPLALFVVMGLGLAGPAVSAQVPPVPPTPETPRVPRVPRPPRDDRDRGRYEETDRKTLTLARATELELSNLSGDIVVLPGNGPDARIEYTRHGYGDTPEEARRQLGLLEVNLTTGGDGRGQVSSRYVAATGDRGRRRIRSSVDYRVTAPPQTRIRVKSMSGDVQISKIKGDLSLETLSGNINVDAGGRVSLAKTMSGDVVISGVTAEDPLVVQSMSGTVTLRSVKARYVDVNSVSGDVVVRDVVCERAELQTLSGNVEYSGQLLRNGRYELKAHSGDIRLAVSGNTGFDVEANSFSGKIRTDLPIKNELADEEGGEVYAGGVRVKMPKRASFRGTYRDGSATIELTTFSGNIVITK
jgi:putative adhesin